MATREYKTASRKASFVFESFNRTKIVLSYHFDSASSLILQQKWRNNRQNIKQVNIKITLGNGIRNELHGNNQEFRGQPHILTFYRLKKKKVFTGSFKTLFD